MVRPRAENYEERRKEILDAAASMFAEKGFDGASISQIARRCGVSKALLYHYYQSKEELLFSMLHLHVNLLVEVAAKAVAKSDNPKEQLKYLIRDLMQLYIDTRDKHIVLLNSLHSLNEEQQMEIRDLERSLVKTIKDILSAIRPDFSEHEKTSMAMYLMGAINWTYTWFKPDGAISHRDYADMACATFLNGIISLSPSVGSV